MKGLLIKDASLVWRNQRRTLFIVLFLGCFLSMNTDSTFTMTFLAILGAMVGVAPLGYDEHENSMSFLLTLPVSRGAYVRERYLFAIAAGLMCIALGRLLLVITAAVMNRETGAGPLPWLPIVIAFLMLAFVIGVMLPLRLYFGSEKAQIAQAGSFFILFGGIGVIPLLIEKLAGIEVVPVVTGALQQAGPVKTTAGAFIMILLMFLISEQISERIVKKKEY